MTPSCGDGVQSVCVIGGGPAGASAARGLAEAGVDVTLVESRVFPRMKVCGEFVSPAATELLEKLVGTDQLIRMGANRVDRFVLEVGEREHVWKLPRPAWALSRSTLDAALLRGAREAGVHVIQPAAARRVVWDRRAIVELTTEDRIIADVVVHADGSGRLDPNGPVGRAPDLIGCKCHFADPTGAVEGVRMRSGRGAYMGTIGLESGVATCALAARCSLIKTRAGDLDRLANDLWPGFCSFERTSEWKTCPIARSGYHPPGHPRSIRVGNAAGAVDPIGGEGIGLALWSGTTCASLLVERGLNRTRTELARRYRDRLRLRSMACRSAAGLMMRPRLVQALWPLVCLDELFVRPWYAMTKTALVK